MKFVWFAALALLVLLAGCQDPADGYYKEITKNGFIPFKQPMGNVRTGTILRGKPSHLVPMAPPTSCFPDTIDGKPTQLRWESDTSLAQTHYSSQLDFNASLNTVAAVGTPSLTFKFEMQKIKKVDFEANGVTVEMLDQFVLEDFYRHAMSDRCREQVLVTPFIFDALQAKTMSYVFLDIFGGKVALDVDNINQIVDIGVDVSWHIENGYKLVVTTPKFLGYHLAQLRTQDAGLINLVSFEVDEKNDAFIWTELVE